METKLSREKIIKTAFQLLEETPDIKRLSMRNIAKKIGVQAPALYWYFQNKQALLQSMAEDIESQLQEPDLQENWKDTLFLYMENYYELYQRIPCALEIEIQTIPSSPSRLIHYNNMLGVLRMAGFSVETSFTAVSSLRHLLFGLLVDAHEEQQIYSKILNGDQYLSQQVVLMKQSIQEHQLKHVEESFRYRQNEKHKDIFRKMITLFLNSLETEK
ncbi:TetR family transcriptional regulator [Enterococcus sp. BWB1-3]|uniref:TetR family transcriptional regulator n=1 Tax=unclassified Enterococcus TaxID=2608891 RepID=UPI0019249DC0|nr:MULTISPECIES: TetR family transcriptional regulator [unclassified Enterococcus]MBL1227653.1 TetR family transcriptional regulator [Enterococcus sp. BWB1-3]MCB5952159.1 TetR family transcriptional regulator [Enterococcus sp. BWT-B8]MCB5954432.1 TetR family transcriptional regulator [Enterococcus sp. CWB-B31]